MGTQKSKAAEKIEGMQKVLDRIYQFAPEDRKRVVDATAIYLDGALAAKRILAAQNPA